MSKKLVIVESPGKIKKITSILGNDYLVMASVGHIRNLDPKGLGIDVNNNFKPNYIIVSNKKKVVRNLKEAVRSCSEVILAADEDREGEAIAASLAEELKLKNPKRIVFNSITKKDILKALKNPREIDHQMVNAQKTRMILDKIVGYRLCPLLWQNVAHKLSAGRVQSVVVKLIIEREQKIESHDSNNYFKIIGHFEKNKISMKSILNLIDEKKSNDKILKGDIIKLKKEKHVLKLFKMFMDSKFTVHNVHDKLSKKNPSPPFITSSLQQEASYKLGFSPKTTMSVAQKLYEGGHITYMRTDSTNLSKEALESCKKYITSKFSDKYYKLRVYKSKSKNAQEAHEAIRPTHIEYKTIQGNDAQIRLYSLIWKRTLASQMSHAIIKTTYIQIEINNDIVLPYYFESSIEKIKFDGFLKVYNLSNLEKDENINQTMVNKIPKKGDQLDPIEILANEEYSKSIGRYTEASLVKELEKKGIGRPSTFANIIEKIQDKKYIEKKNVTGEKKMLKLFH